MVDFGGALSALSGGITLLKELSQAEREYDKATLKLKIAELAGALATAQLALSEAQLEASAKDRTIATLKESFQRRAELVEHAGYRYDKGSDGMPQGSPYCPRCSDQDGILMHLTECGRGLLAVKCPQCNAEYHGAAIYTWEAMRTKHG